MSRKRKDGPLSREQHFLARSHRSATDITLEFARRATRGFFHGRFAEALWVDVSLFSLAHGKTRGPIAVEAERCGCILEAKRKVLGTSAEGWPTRLQASAHVALVAQWRKSLHTLFQRYTGGTLLSLLTRTDFHSCEACAAKGCGGKQ